MTMEMALEAKIRKQDDGVKGRRYKPVIESTSLT